jgi:DNA-binding FadR family transcriptional regulator
MHRRVTASIGAEIVSGELAQGAVLRLDDIATRFQVSRTVSRDAMHELEGLGLVESRRRVGLVVQPMSRWRALHPTLIALRIGSPRRQAQLRSLTELRLGVEPTAAAFAASRRTESQAEELVELVRLLEDFGTAVETTRFAETDARFHSLLLEASDNEMFAAMGEPIVAALRARAAEELMPTSPHMDSFALHRRVADAVARRDARTAEEAMRAIVVSVMDEIASTR